jgi:hypothetical protein
VGRRDRNTGRDVDPAEVPDRRGCVQRLPVIGDLEAPGLYYSYGTKDGGGQVVFMPRAEILQKLGG